MKNLLIILSLTLLTLVPVTSMAKEKKELPEYTGEGLQLIPNSKRMAVVYAEPGANLSQYKRVYLVDPYVAFKKNWQRDQNRSYTNKVRTSDMDRIKIDVAKLFMEVFTEELEEGGYTFANERAEDVLIVKPAIIDLDVTAPDIRSAGRVNTFTRTTGSMTLYLELYDSETDDLLAKALDPKGDRGNGVANWSTTVSNKAAGRRMMKPWAKALREDLDEARDPEKQN